MEMELVTAPASARPVARAKLAPRYDASLLAARPAELAPAITVGELPSNDGLPPSRSTYAEERSSAEPFGRWLLGKKIKGDESAIGVCGFQRSRSAIPT